MNVQGSKTQIFENKDIETELFPPGMEELNATIDNINDALQKDKISFQAKKDFKKELKKQQFPF